MLTLKNVLSVKGVEGGVNKTNGRRLKKYVEKILIKGLKALFQLALYL